VGAGGMKLEAFIIHLKRATARRRQVDALAGELTMPVTVMDAVDSLALSDETISRVYKRRLHTPAYPFELRKSEIACFLSHRAAWREIVDRKLDFGLILEDDVRLEPGFSAALEVAAKAAKPGDYIRFPRWPRGERGPDVAADGGNSVLAPKVPGLGTQTQLVGHEAAARLLSFTGQFDRPVDTTLQMYWLHKVRMLSARPIVIAEIDHLIGGSVIQNKAKSIREILSRELKRTNYRLRVKLAALGNQ
jgi:GR25 family glycosyltransferase involved in LPS biosynthesis